MQRKSWSQWENERADRERYGPERLGCSHEELLTPRSPNYLPGEEEEFLQLVKLDRLPPKVPSSSKIPSTVDPWAWLLVRFSWASQHLDAPQPYPRMIYTTYLIVHKNYFKILSIFPMFIYLIRPFLIPFQNQNHALYLSESSIPSTTLCTYWAI